MEPPVVIADDDVTTIVVTGIGTDALGDPGYSLALASRSDRAVFVYAVTSSFTVNGAAHEASLYEALEPGADVGGFMSFLRDGLGGGTEALQATEGTVEVVDKDTYETLATYAFVM